MGFYHSDTVSISLFESTAWDFESRQSMKAKHWLTMLFAVSVILISHMLVCLYHLLDPLFYHEQKCIFKVISL